MRVLYIDIDSLRPDHLGCYGYHRNTSPHIDALAASGARFTNFYACDAPCMPSRTALFSGRFGLNTGVVNHGYNCADLVQRATYRDFNNTTGAMMSWVGVLRKIGYYTACCSSFAERHAAWWYYDGFREIQNSGKQGHETADEVVPWALEWLRQKGKKDNWFLHLNLWDPHTYYRTPQEYGNPFEDSPPPDWMSQELIEQHTKLYGPHSAQTPHHVSVPDQDFFRNYPRLPYNIANLDDYKRWIDGYDIGISYADFWIGKVFDLLKELGLWDDTLVIVSADHGENQGELNVYGDHQLADNITHRIPLIIKGPGIRQGSVDQELHYNLDLGPTVLEILGSASCPEMWDGQSFATTLTDGHSCGRPYLILSHAAWSIQRSVRFGQWLFIETHHDGFKEIIERKMLFDVKADPHELNNVIHEQPEVTQKARAFLQEWLSENLANSPSGQDPHLAVLHSTGPSHAASAQLLDYAEVVKEVWGDDAARDLIRRHTRDYHRYLLNCYRFADARKFLQEHKLRL